MLPFLFPGPDHVLLPNSWRVVCEIGQGAAQLLEQAKRATTDAEKLKLFIEARQAAVREKISLVEAEASTELGTLYSTSATYELAIEAFTNAIRLFELLRKEPEVSAALLMLGQAEFDGGKPKESIATLKRALALRKKLKDARGEAVVLGYLGTYVAATGQQREGATYLKAALPIHEKLAEWDAVAILLMTLGSISYQLGQDNDAVRYFERSLEMRKRAPNPREEAATLANLGVVRRSHGQIEEAARLYEKALAIVRKSKDEDFEAAILANLGYLWMYAGDRKQAMVRLEESLALAEKIKNKRAQLVALKMMGRIYADRGERQMALAYFERALTFRQEGLEPGDEATILTQMGGIWHALGNAERALGYFEQALDLNIKGQSLDGQAMQYNNMGVVWDAQEQHVKALGFFQRALSLYRQTQDAFAEASVLGNIGTAWQALGDLDKGERFMLESLQLHRRARDLEGQGVVLSNLGKVAQDRKQPMKAIPLFERSLALAGQTSNLERQSRALYSIAQCWKQAGNLPTATLYAKQAVLKYQNLRDKVKAGGQQDRIGDAGRKSYDQTIAFAYSLLASLLQDQGRIAEALRVLEMLKDKELETFEQRRVVDPQKLSLSEDEVKVWDTLERRYVAMSNASVDLSKAQQTLLTTPSSGPAKAKEREATEKITQSSEDVLKEIERWSSNQPEGNAAARRLEQAKDLEPLKAVLARAGQAAGVMVFLTPDAIRLWVVTAEEDFVAETPISAQTLNILVAQMAGALRSPELDPREPAGRLYEALVRPIEDHLKVAGIKNVMWSLDGVLRYIPIAALWDAQSKQFYAEKWPSPLFRLKGYQQTDLADSATWSIAAFSAGKDLPGAQKEAEGIVNSILPGEIFSNERFTELALKQALQTTRRPVQHWASHFMCSPGDMTNSYLLLGDGAKLSLDQLASWGGSTFAFTDLLCLSACETAVGAGDGSEVEGLAALALNKGAKAVIATLWPISDAATPNLMLDFYRLRKSGLSKSEALRQAQVNLMKGGAGASNQIWRGAAATTSGLSLPKWPADSEAPFRHPHYWAGFVLAGNWK